MRKRKATYVKLDAFETMFLQGLLFQTSLQINLDRVRNVPDEQLPEELARVRNMMLKIEKAALYTNNRQVQRSVYHDGHPATR